MTDMIRKSDVEQWQDNAKHLAEIGMYRPEEEHDACGVGLIASMDGMPHRSVVEAGINALQALWHRGAVAADGTPGDRAGLHVQIPKEFFRRRFRATGFWPGAGQRGLGRAF